MDMYFEALTHDEQRWDFLEDVASVLEEPLPNDDPFINNRPQQTVQCLQRDLITQYGSTPKMEDRIYSTCEMCEQVFNPHTVSNHQQHCPGKGKVQSQFLKKKVKSKKKQQTAPLPPPPLFKKETGPPVLSRFSETPQNVPELVPLTEGSLNVNVTIHAPKLGNETAETLPCLPPSPPLSPIIVPDEDSSSSSSSRHKKSKKSAKILKDYDPNLHCGVIDGSKGPCTRSITCSNHKIQLRKAVPGRSKDIHQLIAEKKAAKDKDSKKRVTPPRHVVTIEPKASTSSSYFINEQPINVEITESADEKFVTTRVPLLPNLSDNDMHVDKDIDGPSQLESGYCSIETTVSSRTRSPPSAYYNPISPLYLVTPLQIVQKENNLYVEVQQEEMDVEMETSPPELSPTLPDGAYFLTIPDSTANLKFYKSHPKPSFVATFGARKLSGAIIRTQQRLEYQRNDIQLAINTKRRPTSGSGCKVTSYNVPAQRSILLKTTNKGANNRVNCKRTSTDKISGGDSKQIKIGPDVNGFLLHTDMSEFAEAPHNCIQENINLLNMK